MNRFSRLLLLSLFVLFTACSSPEEKALEYYETGQALLESGDYVKARLEFQNALQINQKMTTAWYGLAIVAEKQANWQEMFGLLNQVLELDSGHLQAQIKLGRLLLVSGQLDKAMEAANTAMELAPADANVYALQAAVFYKLEDVESALKFANEALAIDPGSIDAIAVLARASLAAGNPEQALKYLDQGSDDVALQLIRIDALTRLGQLESVEQVYRNLIRKFPDNSAFMHRLAGFYIEQERQADAEQIYRDVMEGNPGDLEAKLNLVRYVNTVHGMDAAITEVKQFIRAEPENMELYFVLSQMYESVGQLDAAAQNLQLVVAQAQSADDKFRAMALLATVKLQKGEEDEAKALVDKVLEQDPRNEQALIIRTTQLIEDRKLDEAISSLRTVLKDSPDSARALFMLGKAHELSGSRELADDLYERAFQAGGQSPDYGVPYAAFLLRIHRLQRASDVLEDTLRVQPNHVESLTLLAQIRIDQGDWVGAQIVADKIAVLEGAEGVSQQIRGVVHAGQKNHDQSITAFRRAYQASPSESRPMVSLVQAYVRAGQEDEAIEFLQTALSANQGNDNARLLMGQVYASSNKYDEAEAAFREVISRDPVNTMAYQNLASLNLRAGKPEEAIHVLDEGLGESPGDAVLMYTKADIYEKQQNYDAAIDVYEQLMEKYPNAVVIVNNLASLLTDHREDKASLEKAHALALRFRGSEIPHFQDTLGWTYYRLGKLEDASKLIEEANKKMPNVPVFRYHLGMVYAAQQRPEQARSEFEKALELAGDNAFPFRENVEQAMREL